SEQSLERPNVDDRSPGWRVDAAARKRAACIGPCRNSYVIRVEQRCPGRALRRGEVGAAGEVEYAAGGGIGGDFYVTAVAAARTAGRGDLPGESGGPVRPDGDRPARARCRGAGVQSRGRVDRRRLGGRKVARAVEIAADPNGAAAGRAGCVDARRGETDPRNGSLVLA